MFGVSKKIYNVLLILSVGLAFPVLSLSQEQNEISAERIDTQNLTGDVGLPTLDEIKEIEAQLERPPPEEKSVESQASKMEPAQIEQRVRQLESDVAAAKKIFSQRKELADFDQAVERVIQSAERLPETRIEDLKFEISELLKNQRDMHLDQIGPLEVRVLKQESDKVSKS